jgi:hypothetical protein
MKCSRIPTHRVSGIALLIHCVRPLPRHEQVGASRKVKGEVVTRIKAAPAKAVINSEKYRAPRASHPPQVTFCKAQARLGRRGKQGVIARNGPTTCQPTTRAVG